MTTQDTSGLLCHFLEPLNRIKKGKIEIFSNNAAHVVFRTSFITTCGFRFVSKDEFGFVPAQSPLSLTSMAISQQRRFG